LPELDKYDTDIFIGCRGMVVCGTRNTCTYVTHTTHALESLILGQEAQAIVEESFKHLHITPRWATIAMWENV